MDMQEVLTKYTEELTEAATTREFAPLVGKWFAPECSLTFRHESRDRDTLVKFWTEHIRTGVEGEEPLKVDQQPYKIEGRRMFSWRAAHGGPIPKPLWGWQETEFDDGDLVSEIVITSVQDEPDTDIEPGLTETEVGRLFLAFHDAFAHYFATSDAEPLEQKLAADVHVLIDSAFWNRGVIGPHNRIHPGATFALKELEQENGNQGVAQIDVTRGEIQETAPWEVKLSPEGKISDLVISGGM